MKHRSSSRLDLDTLSTIEAALSSLPDDITVKDVRSMIAALRVEAGGDSPYAAIADADFDSPAARAQASMAAILGRAQMIVERDNLAPLFPSKPKAETPAPELVVATSDAILRSAAIARSEVTPLPVDPLARAILKAAAKRRGEDMKDRPL